MCFGLVVLGVVCGLVVLVLVVLVWVVCICVVCNLNYLYCVGCTSVAPTLNRTNKSSPPFAIDPLLEQPTILNKSWRCVGTMEKCGAWPALAWVSEQCDVLFLLVL